MTDSLVGVGSVEDEIKKNKVKGDFALGSPEKVTTNDFNALQDTNSADTLADDVEGTRDENISESSPILEFFNNLEKLLKNSVNEVKTILNGDVENREVLETELSSLNLALEINDLNRKIETTSDSQRDSLLEQKRDLTDKKLDLDLKMAQQMFDTSTNEKDKRVANVNMQTSALYKENNVFAKKIAELKKELASAKTDEERLRIQNEMNDNKLNIEKNSIKASEIVLNDINDRLKQEMSEGERKQLEKEKVFFEKILQHNTSRAEFVSLTKQVDNATGKEKEELKAQLDQKQRTTYKQENENFLKIVKQRDNEIAKQQTTFRENLQKTKQPNVQKNEVGISR